MPHRRVPGAGRGWLTLTPFPHACSSLSASPEIPEHPLASYEDCGHQASKQEALPAALCQGPCQAAPDLLLGLHGYCHGLFPQAPPYPEAQKSLPTDETRNWFLFYRKIHESVTQSVQLLSRV